MDGNGESLIYLEFFFSKTVFIFYFIFPCGGLSTFAISNIFFWARSLIDCTELQSSPKPIATKAFYVCYKNIYTEPKISPSPLINVVSGIPDVTINNIKRFDQHWKRGKGLFELWMEQILYFLFCRNSFGDDCSNHMLLKRWRTLEN